MRYLIPSLNTLRFWLIGILVAMCLIFYVHKWGPSLPPFSPAKATTLCASIPGCKSIHTKWDYDIEDARGKLVVHATLIRKSANANAAEPIQQAIDQHQSQLSWLHQTLWAAPRLEVHYE